MARSVAIGGKAVGLGLLVGLAALSGCVRETNVGGQHVFTYELWVPVSAMLAGIAAVPAGWLLRRVWARGGWGLLVVVGPILMILCAPSLLRDRVVLDDQGFTLRTGIWGLTSVHEVSFKDTRRVRLTTEKETRRGVEHEHHYMLFEMKDGDVPKVPFNNTLCEAAAPHILKAVKAHGIPVERR